ncbi:hypothetical protein QNA08_07065 [Chelatococcus sp. SYSU_G07232]|uniref:Uncharacterized protein n=1 Tax=Chelatococcus albus TaxID=3047466 RepID=A0ABT7AF49_9HYPH|nr:hypothetical protein [Chelatococcus sp. SYSU_G07232]MDJ1157992.1 hypothetical protein [Chelatococcus sp. SYSU_G07232]
MAGGNVEGHRRAARRLALGLAAFAVLCMGAPVLLLALAPAGGAGEGPFASLVWTMVIGLVGAALWSVRREAALARRFAADDDV